MNTSGVLYIYFRLPPDESGGYAQVTPPELRITEGLSEAHDFAVEHCYRSRPFECDEEWLEYLFKLYEQMIGEEKEKGTLFGGEKKKKSQRT